jgi:hypothetical protein
VSVRLARFGGPFRSGRRTTSDHAFSRSRTGAALADLPGTPTPEASFKSATEPSRTEKFAGRVPHRSKPPARRGPDTRDRGRPHCRVTATTASLPQCAGTFSDAVMIVPNRPDLDGSNNSLGRERRHRRRRRSPGNARSGERTLETRLSGYGAPIEANIWASITVSARHESFRAGAQHRPDRNDATEPGTTSIAIAPAVCVRADTRHDRRHR